MTDVLVSIGYSNKWVMSEKDAAALLQILTRTTQIDPTDYVDGYHQSCKLNSIEMTVVSLKSKLPDLVQEAEVVDMPVHRYIKETTGIRI